MLFIATIFYTTKTTSHIKKNPTTTTYFLELNYSDLVASMTTTNQLASVEKLAAV